MTKALLALALAALVIWQSFPDVVPLLLLAVGGAFLIVTDVREHRLPNAIILPGYAVVAAYWLVVALATGRWTDLLTALLGGAVTFVGFVVLAVLARGMLGYGDVKLAGLIGLVLGWFGWLTLGRGIVVAILLHGLYGLVTLIITRDRKAEIPMGPALIVGAALAAFLA